MGGAVGVRAGGGGGVVCVNANVDVEKAGDRYIGR
jgi:hypothetical protein